MKTLHTIKIILIITIIFSFLFLSTNPVQAAFPIHSAETIKKENAILKKNPSSQIKVSQQEINNLKEKKETEKEDEDEGIYGILALTFGLIGFFPAAIVLGIIGLQRHRKYQGLAVAGLILGLLPVIVLLIVLGVFIAVI